MNDHLVPDATAVPGSTPLPPVSMNPDRLGVEASAHETTAQDRTAAESANRLSSLLMGLGEAATGELPGAIEPVTSPGTDQGSSSTDTRPFENQLAMVRLGMATSLFYALRTKHAPTAAHSLRVALACSAWCERLGLGEGIRDRIEVAALLHDIGKIGIPDRILRKPGKLSVEEQLTMDCCSELGCEILRGCTADQALLDTIKYASAWYESRRRDDGIHGDALPLGARMLSIAGAFDAMTTDQVYRAAFSRERALKELFRGSGTQFDPELTRDFATMLERRPELLHSSVVNRWLQQLDSKAPAFFHVTSPSAGAFDSLSKGVPLDVSAVSHARSVLPYYEALGNHLRDGVAFIDRDGQVTYWNDMIARMTGVASEAMVGRHWDADTMGILVENGDEAIACPVAECLRRQTMVTRSMKISLGERSREVMLQATPVQDPFAGGSIVIVRDMSDRAELQSQIQSLHKKATSDPLTGIANRAEFDSRLLHATAKAQQTNQTFSLIICDIDHFKQVNDVHGHPAGDEALIQFARVLENHTRDEDLVARYGGEEFVFLAINSDNPTAARRAEQIRCAVEKTPLDGLGGESVTVSFGVTEYQAGDAADTILARADRALLQAKENGRNRVVQLGSGRPEAEEEQETTNWFSWLTSSKPKDTCEFQMAAPVPTDLAVEKLRGFISDHRAEIIQVNGNELSLRIVAHGGNGRRTSDHQMALNVSIHLSEALGRRGQRGAKITQTAIDVTIRPVRSRDRRSRDLQPCVKQVLGSLKSYLMAELIQNNDD